MVLEYTNWPLVHQLKDKEQYRIIFRPIEMIPLHCVPHLPRVPTHVFEKLFDL